MPWQGRGSMAKKHFAFAKTTRKNIAFDEWMEEIRAQNEGAVPKDFVNRTAKTILRKCDPKQYLLSHATIVASVDLYAPKGVKTGRLMNRGCQIDVKWPEFRIKPECHELVNNNGDAWERSLLLSTYRSFIGAHNYLEHIQLPELSKGFIVDAIARDLGNSCYIDILVATDRKHTQLVSDILSGAISGLSMGCISIFTTCSKCGNVASDDAQLCPCIQYDGKLSTFVDEAGLPQVLAEIIGHVSIANSNQFIEASWVRNPAFRGAVRRNILNADATQIATRMDESSLINSLRSSIPEMEGLKKAASTRIPSLWTVAKKDDPGQRVSQADQGDDLFADAEPEQGGGQGGGGQDPGQGASADQSQDGPGASESPDAPGSASPDKPESEDKIENKMDKLTEKLLDAVIDRVTNQFAPKPEDVGTVAVPATDLTNGNDNLIQSSAHFDRLVRRKFASHPGLVAWARRAYRIVHEGGRRAIQSHKLSAKDLIVLSWIEDRCRGRDYPSDLYKVAMQVGPSSSYPSQTSFVAACSIRLGRSVTPQESRFLQWKGRIASVATQF